jgi:hypothetical protein
MVSSTLGKVGNICGKKQLKEDERRQSAVEFLTCAALRSCVCCSSINCSPEFSCATRDVFKRLLP